MDNWSQEIKNGRDTVKKYRSENEEAKKKASLPFLILNDAFPLLVVVAYVLLGVLAGLWHPGWIVFLAIPFYYMTVECIKHKSASLFPMPILVVVAYLLLGFLGGLWHPYWLLFLVIPLYYTTVSVMKGGNVMKLVNALVPILVAGVYLVIGFVAHAWHPGWVVFLAIPVYYSVANTVRRYRSGEKKEKEEKHSDDDVIDIK